MQHKYLIWHYIDYDWLDEPDPRWGRDPPGEWREAVEQAAYRGEDARVHIEEYRSILLINDPETDGGPPTFGGRKEFMRGSIPARQWLDLEKKKEQEDEDE